MNKNKEKSKDIFSGRYHLAFWLVIVWMLASPSAMAQPDPYMQDTPADTGIEPNPDSGPMWVTEDIWVRRSPDPSYQAVPFLETAPAWIPQAHQNPEYRDPIFSVPNYVYVRVRNRGTSASTGNERLKLYWAMASTGLGWDTHWVDYLASNCGPTRLYGGEITKPRKNAATASPAERAAYRDAILDAGTLSAFAFADGVSYWHKQNVVHQGGPSNRHGTSAFLPWHRELINRYEVLLQKTDPLVKLLYWDWTTDPENSTGGFNFFTSSFMGASGQGTGAISIGSPFIPVLLPPPVTRNLGAIFSTPPANPDSSLLAIGTYPSFAFGNESSPNHDWSHVYIGGNGGNMSSIPTAAADPFFFLLHANVDRLWAQWQRNPTALLRLETATTYGSESSSSNITSAMGPWNGSTTIEPWTTSPLGGHIVSKTPAHPSVVAPPIYDTAPLTIPALAPGEAVVIQVPWYPPNPADFSCLGSQQGHVCLLARIETSTTAPFGMTFPEGVGINTNTRNNNNIVWKNVTVVDNFTGPLGLVSFFGRNIYPQAIFAAFQVAEVAGFDSTFFDVGRIYIDLGPELYNRWLAGGALGTDVEPAENHRIQILSPTASVENLLLEPEEAFPVDIQFELFHDFDLVPGDSPRWDVLQMGAPGDPEEVVGGNRYEVDFRNLALVQAGSPWRYEDTGQALGPDWRLPDYDDSGWKLGRGRLGFGSALDTTIDGGPAGDRHISTYFRHTFEVEDPTFFRSLLLRWSRDDGGVVYLNGNEIHRANMPAGDPEPGTLATREVRGLEENVFFPQLIGTGPELLTPGSNVLAVEIHQDSPSSDDLSFDLELAANVLTPRVPPALQFAELTAGAMLQPGQILPVTIEALAPNTGGEIATVSLFVDGAQIGEADPEPPYAFEWAATSPGLHRLRALAADTTGERSIADLAVSVVTNVPPSAELLQPLDHAIFQGGEPIQLAAEASDPGGIVERVEFYRRNMATWFTEPPLKVGTADSPPYSTVLTLFEAGHYMLYAVAFDTEGAEGQSNPAHIEIQSTSKDGIFADGFESGDVSAWSSVSNPPIP